MARVQFSALIEEMVGKLAGSVFQGSYGGFQIRTRVTPRNPQSPFQQLRRGEFGYITALWRSLSSTDRDSWQDNAPGGMSGFNFFVQSNINLSLIDLAPIAAYESADTPDAMPMSITSLGNGIFSITASGIITSVPSGQSLLLFATAEKLPGKIFTSPSQYTPIASFPAGTDFSGEVDIAAYWIDRFGQFTSGKRICIATNLISTVNGARGEQSITCADESQLDYMTALLFIDATTPSSPTLTENFNNIGTLSISHFATGQWRITSSGLFTDDKTNVLLSVANSGGATYVFYAGIVDSSTIYIWCIVDGVGFQDIDFTAFMQIAVAT